MTDRELMQQALEALEWAADHIPQQKEPVCDCPVCVADVALRERLAQPEQEPVCDKDPQGCWNVRCQLGKVCKNTSPRREWVGLTDTDIEEVWADENLGRYATSYAIEAKLKEKNA